MLVSVCGLVAFAKSPARSFREVARDSEISSYLLSPLGIGSASESSAVGKK